MRHDERHHLLASLPSSEGRLLARARILFDGGDISSARELLEAASSRAPSAAIHRALAITYRREGRLDDALGLLQRLVRGQPNHVPSIRWLAEAQISAGQTQQAQRSIARLQALGAPPVSIRALLDRLHDATNPDHKIPHKTLEATLDPDQVTTSQDHPSPLADATATGSGLSTPRSSIFEQGSFSNLSSQALARGAARLDAQDPLDSSVFETLVNHTFEDASEDISFDLLLSDLGVDLGAPSASDDLDQTIDRLTESALIEGVLVDSYDLGSPDEKTEAVDIASLSPRGRQSGPIDPFEDSITNVAEPQHPAPQSTPPDAAPSPRAFPDERPTQIRQPPAERPIPTNSAPEAAPDHALEADPSWIGLDISLELDLPPEQQPPSNQPSSPVSSPEHPARGPSPRHTGRFEQAHVPNPSAAAQRPPAAQRPEGDSPPIVRTKAARQLHAWWARLRAPSNAIEAALVIAACSLILIGGLGAWMVSALDNNLGDHLQEAQRHRRLDTFPNSLKAQQSLLAAASAHSFAGAGVDRLLDAVGMMPDSVQIRRQTALMELALLSAQLEFRYSTLDAHDAAARIVQASPVNPRDPRLISARAYLLLSQGRYQQARELLSDASTDFPRSAPLAAAITELELLAQRPSAAAQASSLFRETEQFDVYPRYLVARVELAQGKSTASPLFERILRDSSPDHLSARIAHSYALRHGSDQPRALNRAEGILAPVVELAQERAAPLQSAMASIALGEIERARAAPEKAAEHYKAAIEAAPTRPQVYPPLVSLHLHQGRFDLAEALAERAIERVGRVAPILLLKARVLYHQGRFEDSLSTLSGLDARLPEAALLQGANLMALANPRSAAESFDRAGATGGELGRLARAMAYAARAHLEPPPQDDQISQVDQWVLDAASSAPLRRAAALLRFATSRRHTRGSLQKDLLIQADDALRHAAELRPDWYLIEYDRCRVLTALGKTSEAFARCKRAIQLNPMHRPGVRVAVQLAILRGEFDQATALASGLLERFPDAPDATLAVARALIAQQSVGQARVLLDSLDDLDPDVAAHRQLIEGLLAFHERDLPAARRALRAAHQDAPWLIEADLFGAWAAAQLGDSKADAALRARLDDPLWAPRAWHALGDLRLSQGRLKDATENFVNALDGYRRQNAPAAQISEAYAGLARASSQTYGWNHYLTRRYVSRASSRGDESSVPAHMIRGVYHLRKRRPQLPLAADHLERVLAQAPYRCDATEVLLGVYQRLDRPDDLTRVRSLQTKFCN